jgi:hypothetical protein
MRRWVGRWLAGVGILHILFGVAAFADPLREIAADGFWNAVDAYPDRSLAFWFVFAGPLIVLLGALVDRVEARAPVELPRFLGWTLLIFALLGGILMPLSGFWLFLPPALGVLLGRPTRTSTSRTVEPVEEEWRARSHSRR